MESGLSNQVKIGVVGCGHLGKIHLKLLKELPIYSLQGVYDADAEVRATVSGTFGVRAYDSLEQLIPHCDALDVVTPTVTHYETARLILRHSKHLFIEKPMTATPTEAKTLESLAIEAGVVAQVGHVERFNPAFLAIKDQSLNPMFIECHRLAAWNPRGTDVSVVLDLMIHDLDIVLHLVQSPIKKVSASGVAVVSDTPDIANARIEFHNGCVANLTASRISLKNMRKMRIFQKNAYLSLDFLEKKTIRYNVLSAPPEDGSPAVALGITGQEKYLQAIEPPIPEVNAIKMELEAFAEAITKGIPPPVTFTDGVLALQIAWQIAEKAQG